MAKKIYELTLADCQSICRKDVKNSCQTCPIARECMRFFRIPPVCWELDAETEIHNEDYKS